MSLIGHISESDYNKQMKSLVSSIEAEIGDKLSKGIEPELIILNGRTLDSLLEYLIDPNVIKTINWKEPLNIAFAEGTITLRVIRTMDLVNGQIIIK